MLENKGTLSKIWGVPVSYTHLDVYKRQGFGQSVETFFSTIGNFLYLLTLIGLVAQLGISIFLLIASITSFILIFEVRAKRKNTYIQLEKVNFERRGMYYSQIMSDYSFGKDIRIDNLGKWLMGKFKYQLDVNEKFYKEMGKNKMCIRDR
uniref:Uncharacterized protein n=1 Tax=Candidatus Enterococcus clewellii TaxID=1834193 RepID=A0A242K4L0_9ENTE|nr:hypothetical protein [Enterococcus sp. 9E7_DIV0242]OTP14467.1 hypothetical protein A5888_002568 [Enterococcus sp. 9E7_DIV0242]